MPCNQMTHYFSSLYIYILYWPDDEVIENKALFAKCFCSQLQYGNIHSHNLQHLGKNVKNLKRGDC